MYISINSNVLYNVEFYFFMCFVKNIKDEIRQKCNVFCYLHELMRLSELNEKVNNRKLYPVIHMPTCCVPLCGHRVSTPHKFCRCVKCVLYKKQKTF